MADDIFKVDLKSEPDAYGFLYGQAQCGDQLFNVNVMPPQEQWQGQFVLEGYEPDKKSWILYVDGEEVARATAREHIVYQLSRALLTG